MQQLIQLSHATTNTRLAELGLEAGRDTSLSWHSKELWQRRGHRQGSPLALQHPKLEENK